MNLMLNGIEAMKDMGAPGKLTISSHQNGDDQLLVSVADMGIGLQPENVEQIFSASLSSKSQGTGMGLPISRSIIESHGGRLWATPKYRAWCNISIRLAYRTLGTPDRVIPGRGKRQPSPNAT